MKISILSPDLSSNNMGRVYLLAKMLTKKFNVEIVGPILGKGVWGPIKDDPSINIKIIKSFKSLNGINGDIIYAIKPLSTSFGYGLLKKYKTKKPLVLDIDDWEFGFFLDHPLSSFLGSIKFWEINNAFYTILLEKFTKCADAITVSSKFLQKKFGGTIIPHVRDSKLFNLKNNPSLDKLKDKKIIMFFGTIRKHKGIDDLILAIDRLNRKDLILMLVGADFNDPYIKELQNLNKEYIKFIGQQPFEKISEFLSIADLIVLPQKKSFSAMGQVPAKIFDAMACGKPIIATNISDLPIILKGCGEIVESGNINELSEKISYLLNNPKIAKALGKKAREKFLKEYSFKAIEPKLFKIFEEVISIRKKLI